MNIHSTPKSRSSAVALFVKILVFIFPVGCTNQSPVISDGREQSIQINSNKLMIVDCLLPGQIRKLGQSFTYLSARRPLKTSATDCEIRGGEYTSFDRSNYATALKIWLPKAKGGDPEAQTYVGEIYEKGRGLAPDHKLAASWYQKAADQNFSRAQINLGYLYEKGLGVEQDLVTALNWYRNASGLQDDDIAFASTIETSVRSEYENEIQLLKNELANNVQQTKQLQSQYGKSQQQLLFNKRKLKQAQEELKRTKKTIQGLKSSKAKPATKQELLVQEKKLQTQEIRVAQQLEDLHNFERQLKTQNENLTAKLAYAEQRTKRLNHELEDHKSKSGLINEQLAITKLQLSSTEAVLGQLREQYSAEKANIVQTQKRVEQQGTPAGTMEKLNAVSKQLAFQNKKSAKLEQQFAALQLEKNQIAEQKRQLEEKQNISSSSHSQQLQMLAKQLTEHVAGLGKQHQKIERLNREKSKLAKEKQALEKQQNTLSSEQSKSFQQELANREQELEKKRHRIALLESETEKYKKQIAEIQISEPTQIAQARPTIEIIEPPFKVTRNRGIPSVILRSPMKHREISGRVQADLGLLSFNINGINTSVNDAGIFKSKVELTGKETAVSTVAIDQHGNRAELEFLLIAAEAVKKQSAPSSSTKKSGTGIDFGKFHALLIGNNIYNYLPSLDTPINDIITLEKILRVRYGFKTTVLSNADRYTTLSGLNTLREKLTEKDNLLIYYAGHGELDRVNLRGHWLPVDAEATNTANWISTVAITDILNTMSAKHILVVADSCYSGAMTRSSLARIEPGVSDEKRVQWLKAMVKTKSRIVMTSGGMKPVLDGGGGDHSVFASIFINALEQNGEILEGQRLYRTVTKQMRIATKKINFEQTPQYAPIRHAGHESGEFFFVPRSMDLSANDLQYHLPIFRTPLTAFHLEDLNF